MPRESSRARAQRSLAIIEGLRRTYPDAHCALEAGNPLELLIATILSAQCTDRQVNLVTGKLFKKYQSAEAYAMADLTELTEDIRRIGLFRNKARFIQSCCRALVDRHRGEVPGSMEHLTALAGVGRKTANVVLGNSFGLNVGVVVDTHVARVARRLQLTKSTSPEAIEKDLQAIVPQELWTLFSHWLIWHGRSRCRARNPNCLACEIRTLCPSAA